MTWTVSDSLAMVRHYLGYELWQCQGRWSVRKGDDCEYEPLPHFPDDREETFRCLEAWMRYHPEQTLTMAWSPERVWVWEINGTAIVTPTLLESILRMLLAEALAAESGSTEGDTK